ncbi:DUF5710 domain-containing protein [Enterococcus innesii]|uniref:DUF5710 domain-containing protein n=1 Tax=Enterococcus innesii TaxID=2839759 RepID=UPI003B59F1FA
MLYLTVAFEQKESAKQLGAKWDPKEKKWYWIYVNKVDAFIESFFETNQLSSCFMVSDNRQTKTV